MIIHFWGLFALATLAGYALACSILGKAQKPAIKKPMAEYDHGLHGGNRDRSDSKFHDWH
jgi:hypothetical protein